MAECHADQPPPDSLDPATEAGAREDMQARARAPAEVLSEKLYRIGRANAARVWTAPGFRARVSAEFKARWADPEYRAKASANNRDDTVYGWRQRSTGLTVRRTKAELAEEFGLRPEGLSDVAAGWTMSTGGWELIPKPRMPVGPRWIFP